MLRNEEIKILVEALPYLRDFKGKTVVVKYGGNAMLNDEIKNKVLQDIIFHEMCRPAPDCCSTAAALKLLHRWLRLAKRPSL